MSQTELRRTSLADIEEKQRGRHDTAFEHGSSNPLIKYSRIINRTDGRHNPVSAGLSSQSLDEDIVYSDKSVEWMDRADQNRGLFEALEDSRGPATGVKSSQRGISTRRNKWTPNALERATITSPTASQIHDTGYSEYDNTELSSDVAHPHETQSSQPEARVAPTDEATRLMPPPPFPRRYAFSTRPRRAPSIMRDASVIPTPELSTLPSPSVWRSHQRAPEAPMSRTTLRSEQQSSLPPSSSTTQRNRSAMEATASSGNSMQQTSVHPAEQTQTGLEDTPQSRGQQPDWLNSPWVPEDDSDDE